MKACKQGRREVEKKTRRHTSEILIGVDGARSQRHKRESRLMKRDRHNHRYVLLQQKKVYRARPTTGDLTIVLR